MSRSDASGRKRSEQRAEGGRSSPKPGQRSEAQPSEVRRTGFTLLEVMAAVALLGILYTVLARVAIEGLRAEGESQRRLEASLLAEARLADVFTGPDGSYAFPQVGRSETTEGDFTLTFDVSPFQPPVGWDVTEPEGIAPQLFASSPGAPGAQGLRTVQLTISWLEGAQERHVSRTTYLLDFSTIAANPALSGKAPNLPGGAGAAQGPGTPSVPSELALP